MQNCCFCQQKLEDIKTDFETNINGERKIVVNVPAVFCVGCNEIYFKKEVVEKIKGFNTKLTRDKLHYQNLKDCNNN